MENKKKTRAKTDCINFSEDEGKKANTKNRNIDVETEENNNI